MLYTEQIQKYEEEKNISGIISGHMVDWLSGWLLVFLSDLFKHMFTSPCVAWCDITGFAD